MNGYMEYEKRLGTFYSWNIVTEKRAVKTGDKTLVEAGETGIPQEIYWFFDCNDLEKGDTKQIKLLYNNEEYEGVIRKKRDDIGRVNLSWRGALHNRVKPLYTHIEGYPSMIFQKEGNDIYTVSVIDDMAFLTDDNTPCESEVVGTEGKRKVVYTTKYERDPKLRKQAILIHGLTCEVCGFDFEKTYGILGRDYIEVHHIKPLNEIGEEVQVNPKTDMICLCSNCHRMIHRKKERVLTPDELRAIIKI